MDRMRERGAGSGAGARGDGTGNGGKAGDGRTSTRKHRQGGGSISSGSLVDAAGCSSFEGSARVRASCQDAGAGATQQELRTAYSCGAAGILDSVSQQGSVLPQYFFDVRREKI